MNQYQVTRTNGAGYYVFPTTGGSIDKAKSPCNIIQCERHVQVHYKENEYVYSFVYFTIQADTLDDAITMLRKEWDNGYFQFVILPSDIDGIEYNIEIYDDWRE